MRVHLGAPRPAGRSDALAAQRLAWQAPELPGLPADLPRRGAGAGGWAPVGAVLLARHRSWDGHYKFSNSQFEPRGYMLDRLLGFVQQDPQPSTRQLTQLDGELVIGDSHDEVPRDHVLLGHVEQLPFVMLIPLHVRRLHATDQHVLVGDERDPLHAASDFVAMAGWMEAAPLEPLGPVEHTAEWGRTTLVRRLDRPGRRHVYDALSDAAPPGAGGTRLGGLWDRPFGAAGSLVGVHRWPDGRLATELASPHPGRPGLTQAVRWAGAPARWMDPRWSARAVAGRATRLARASSGRTAPHGGGPEVIGWARREPAPGFGPVFSATHPVTGDQYVTRSEMEASDLGYLVDGVLGYVADDRADRPPTFEEIPWASRFGHTRRYVEGSMPGSA